MILDTPGLNALGAEPELTLNLLPNAQAVLYVLAADTGVTKTDIQVWHDHIGNRRDSAGKGRLVVLNKIDGLWDGLRPWDEVEREIDRQVRETAATLGVPETNVFPVSAQKALLGKIKNDTELIAHSRIEALEQALARELIPARREIVRATLGGDMIETIKTLRAILGQRLKGVYEHMDELTGLNGKNMEVIEHMMQKVRNDKEVFEQSLQRFQATRSVFTQQTNVLYNHISLRSMDSLTLETRKNMAASLTTVGLKECMENFFRRTYLTMEAAAKQALEIKLMMEGVYRKFQEEYGLANIKPSGLSVARYLREIRRLENKHEQYIKGAQLLLTEQQILTRRFFDSAVSKVRAIYKMANRDTDLWLKNILSPMEAQVREHQIQLRRRLESIKHIHQASETLEERLHELETSRDTYRTQESDLEYRVDAILRRLEEREPTAPGRATRETAAWANFVRPTYLATANKKGSSRSLFFLSNAILIFPRPRQHRLELVLIEERGLAPVSSLGHMMRYSGHRHARGPWHVFKSFLFCSASTNVSMVSPELELGHGVSLLNKVYEEF